MRVRYPFLKKIVKVEVGVQVRVKRIEVGGGYE